MKSFKKRFNYEKRFNYKNRPKLTWEDKKINSDAYKIFYNTDIFKTEFSKVITRIRKNIII